MVRALTALLLDCVPSYELKQYCILGALQQHVACVRQTSHSLK
jgi:hypothetical protein